MLIVRGGTFGGGPRGRLLLGVGVGVAVRVAGRVAVGLGGDLEGGPSARWEGVWTRGGSDRFGGRPDIVLVGDANLVGEANETLGTRARRDGRRDGRTE